MHLSKKQSIKLTIAILVIFFTLSIISIKLNEEKGKQTQDINEASGEFNNFTISKNAEIILNNFERSSMKNGKKEWEVISKKGTINPITKKAILEDTELSLFSKDKIVKLKANHAKMEFVGNELGNAKLKGNIELNINNELILNTETAYYNKKDGIVTTKSPVKIDTEFVTITGDSMKVEIDNQIVTINKNVISVIKPKDSTSKKRKKE